MIVIPVWISNTLFLVSCVLASYQHWKLARENPVATVQFGIIIFSMVMMVAAAIYTRYHRDPWVSLAFFLIAVATFCLTLRQFRTLPNSRAYE